MVSLDLITGLPPSGPEKFTTVLVIVDKLTKYAIMVATHNQLSQKGFACIFVDRVVNVYGLPEHIICDQDKYWSMAFWCSVVSYYGSSLAISSAYHPQTDGQTEVLNTTVEQMMQAYVAEDCASWARWLSKVRCACNFSVHSYTGYSPDFLLFGYQQRVSTAFLVPQGDPTQHPLLSSQKANNYIAVMERHRKSTRDALTLAQERQARAHNKH
jgi:hypothetical protein